MRILDNWYLNKLPRYLTMPFASLPATAYDINMSEFMVLLKLKSFYVETATKRKTLDSIFKSYDFTKIFIGNVYYPL